MQPRRLNREPGNLVAGDHALILRVPYLISCEWVAIFVFAVLPLTGMARSRRLYSSTLRPMAVGVGLTFDRCLLAFALWLFIHAEH